MAFLDTLLGRPLATEEDASQRVGVAEGVPAFGLDALGSAAYGPEAALTILIPAAAAGLAYILPLTLVIILLLTIVFFSYRQTIVAYPNGGGSYTVASENLGRGLGILAAASLMLDYLLDVGVGISTGVGALVSAVPKLGPHTLGLCLVILVVLTFVNLRGARESGAIFMLPTYLFCVCLLGILVWGAAKAFASGGHPHPVVAPPHPSVHTVAAVSTWLLIRAFASGCTALTGIEAVSNGVTAFKDPNTQTANRTLTVIVVLLAVFLYGIAHLTRVYGIVATDPGSKDYQSLLSMLTAAVAGKGVVYYVTIASILVLLSLSANTAFTGFPRLCRAIAEDGYLPKFFAIRGRRLVYTEGIVVLGILSGLILIAFDGITDRLIPLFAIGAFMAFTMSQAGMVFHWRKNPGKGSGLSMTINAIGALATGATVVVVLVAKFTEGAWITVLMIPLLMVLMYGVHRHYAFVDQQAHVDHLHLDKEQPPYAILPISGWNRASEAAVQFACSLTPDVEIVHINCVDQNPQKAPASPPSNQASEANSGKPTPAGAAPSQADAASAKDALPQDPTVDAWRGELASATRAAGLTEPQIIALDSPYRFITSPILNYILKREANLPGRRLAIIVPELVTTHWYQYLLHNHRSTVLKALLLLKGNHRIVVINVPWYLPG